MTQPARSAASNERVETVDVRMLVLVRCVLAFSAFVIIWLDPAEPARAVELTYLSLALYCVYSLALAYTAWKSEWAPPDRALHWIDILFYAYLVSLTEGTSSIFFYFFFYAVLVAAFGWGFREAIAVTVASFVLFTIVGLAFSPTGEQFELNRTLIRSVYLLVFGYMIAHLGGYEIQLKRRLRLLKDVSNVWDSRSGVDQAIGHSLRRLLDFFAAQSCVLVVSRPGNPLRHWMYQASSDKAPQSSIPGAITDAAARPLLALPATIGALHEEPRRFGRQQPRHVAIDVGTHAQQRPHLEECAVLANLFDARFLLTVPYTQPDGTSGRLFVTSTTQRFSVSDIDFLAQVSDALAAVFQNIQLTEEHLARAAEDERAAISRDLHDTTIQPYIGLKLALEALRRDVNGTSSAARRIDELVEMTGATVRDLRDYAVRLRTRSFLPGEALAASVRKHAERLKRFYDLAVEVTADVPAQIDGRLAGEALQMVSEALSNVLRHTRAKAAFVNLRREDSALVIEVVNEAAGQAPPGFLPRSIDERSRTLGGRTTVERRAGDGYTVVRITLPS